MSISMSISLRKILAALLIAAVLCGCGSSSSGCALELGNDFRGMKIGQQHLFIVSGWNSTGAGRHGGLEVVDLIHGTTQYYDSSTIAIPADSQTAIEIVSHGNNNYRLWLGTTNGLAYCNLKL
jgi:hypothetical protein